MELPEVRYRSPSFASFDTIVNEIDNIVRSNPDKAEKYGWPVTREGIANWVDSTNAARCQSYGWTEFTIDDNEPSIEVVPYDGWPLWAKAMAAVKTPEDRGVGDTVERTIGPANSSAIKKFYHKTFGRTCNCDGRRDTWNRKYPYL